MALTKMNTSVHNIQDLSDLPNVTDGLTSAQLKERFDKAGVDLKTYLNTVLTEELDDAIGDINETAGNLAATVVHIQETMPSLSDIYPIGSIYMSINNTNPGTLFGGVWEQIKDTFLLASGDTYEAGTTGGEATHTLTTNEIPAHSHGIKINAPTAVSSGSGNWVFQGSSDVHKWTENAGGGQAHNNMPPYLTVYVWKRVS